MSRAGLSGGTNNLDKLFPVALGSSTPPPAQDAGWLGRHWVLASLCLGLVAMVELSTATDLAQRVEVGPRAPEFGSLRPQAMKRGKVGISEWHGGRVGDRW